MAQAERLAIQSDLAWVGQYNGASLILRRRALSRPLEPRTTWFETREAALLIMTNYDRGRTGKLRLEQLRRAAGCHASHALVRP
jgi:hypothetical protein